MQKCHGDAHSPIVFETRDDKNLKKIIDAYHEDFISYIHKLGLDVSHSEMTINYQHTSITTLTLKTRCFKVDFNDNFVKISPLK